MSVIMTEEDIEQALWDETMAEDDPRYAVYLRSQKTKDPRRREYLRWWEEKYGNAKYYDYCVKYRMWHPSSRGHPDSPWTE